MRTRKLRLKTPAKINLFLQILGARDDGYHDIRSIVVPVSIYDEIVLETTDDQISTVVTKGAIPDTESSDWEKPENNLATKAAVLFRDATGRKEGVRIHLTKNIPICAGLGGGSTDAAAVIVGLNELWNTGIPKNKLVDIGSRAGADVPPLIHGGPVYIEGLGERVAPVAMNCRKDDGGWWVVIANPGFGTSTRDAYARHTSSLTSDATVAREMFRALEEGSIESVAALAVNDLQETVCRKYPLIRIIAAALKTAGGIGVLMCGSGSSVFALARDERRAYGINVRAKQSVGPWLWTRVAKMLPDGVMVAHGPLEARV